MTELFSPLVERAIETAAEWHAGTFRKGRWTDPCAPPPEGGHAPVPAMAHLTAVAMVVQRAGWDDATVAAAFLHDALEDPDRWGRYLDRDVLAAHIGEHVTRIVEAVSEPKLEGDTMLPWRTRKETYLARLGDGPPEAAAVSLADKLHNAYAMASSLEAGIDIFTPAPGRRALSAGPDAQLWFFDAVLETTRRHADPRLAPMRGRLEQEVGRLAALAASRG